jgi:hypothetical protein
MDRKIELHIQKNISRLELNSFFLLPNYFSLEVSVVNSIFGERNKEGFLSCILSLIVHGRSGLSF